MKIFMISQNGDGLGVAYKLQDEGNEVCVYMKNPLARVGLKGIIRQVPSIRLGLNDKPDVILFDMVGQGKIADKLKDEGWPVVGGGEWNDKLELDRKFAMKAMESFGIKTPRSFAFTSLKDATEFVRGHRRLLVLKPHNNKETYLTYVPKTQDELLAFMAHHQKELTGPLTLQEYVEGTEISTEVWYAKGKPVAFPNSTFETKKMLPGDVGPSTGSQTSMVFSYPKREPRIVQQSLKKLSLFMERTQYTGPLDINGIVDRRGRAWFIEFTPRMGYNAIYAWFQLLKEPFGEVLQRVSVGDTSSIKLQEGYGYSMRVTVPPYPYRPRDKKLLRQIYSETRGIEVKADWGKVIPIDVYRVKDKYYTAGFDGVICECTGFGLTPFDAETDATHHFRRISLPLKQARLGDGAKIIAKRVSMIETHETPPFEKKEERNETEGQKISRENAALERKLHVQPGTIVDPRIASN